MDYKHNKYIKILDQFIYCQLVLNWKIKKFNMIRKYPNLYIYNKCTHQSSKLGSTEAHQTSAFRFGIEIKRL